MSNPSPTTYGLLGLLAARPWSGYELTRHLRRSLRFVWPASEGHLYREQKRLVALGWANVSTESVGRRGRRRYTITPSGKAALQAWLRTPPSEPRFEVEGMLRLFHGSEGTIGDLVRSLESTAASARQMTRELAGYADEYLDEGGPMWMVENDVGGPDDRREWHGREMIPERLHVVALVIDGTTRLLDALASFADETAEEVRRWESPIHRSVAADTRRRLDRVAGRFEG